MYFEEQEERDPFEAFGQRDAEGDPLVLDDFDTEPESGPLAARPEKLKGGLSWAGFTGSLAALAWIGAAIGGPLSYFGADAVIAMDPAMQAGLIALAFGPALLFWLSASAAGEALKARRLAWELTHMARGAQAPFLAGASDVRRLTNTVKQDIETLNDAVSAAMKRLGDLEMAAKRNAALFNDALHATRDNAAAMTHALQSERSALVELSGDIRSETEAMAQSINRQARLLRETSNLVKAEVGDAEAALEGQISTMAQHAAAMHDATDGAMHAAGALNGAMSHMLDGLSEATRMTDAARQSTERAAIAASETATALREGTRAAVVEAKRAAQAIRAETEALQDNANETLARLERAAQAARAASEESQAAADRHAATIEKRLSSLAAAAGARKAAPQPAYAPPTRPADQRFQPTFAREAQRAEPAANTSLHAAADAALARRAQREEEQPPRRSFKGFGWTPPREAPKAANEDFALLSFAQNAPEDELKHGAIDLIACAGVDLDDVLTTRDLDRIARFSREGAPARRRAVVDAAPGAVTRIAKHVKRNPRALDLAAEFRARPDLAKSEQKRESSDLVRAYLLIDAALAS